MACSAGFNHTRSHTDSTRVAQNGTDLHGLEGQRLLYIVPALTCCCCCEVVVDHLCRHTQSADGTLRVFWCSGHQACQELQARCCANGAEVQRTRHAHVVKARRPLLLLIHRMPAGACQGCHLLSLQTGADASHQHIHRPASYQKRHWKPTGGGSTSCCSHWF